MIKTDGNPTIAWADPARSERQRPRVTKSRRHDNHETHLALLAVLQRLAIPEAVGSVATRTESVAA
jgi:hypothetical protein